MKSKLLSLCLLSVLVLTAMVGCEAGPIQQPLIHLTYTLQDYSAQGQLISEHTEQSHSYVQGFLSLIYTHAANVAQTSTYQIKDTGGTLRTIYRFNGAAANVDGRCDGGTGITTLGIVAGTGTNAVTETDYGLQTLIANGTGAGQLSYSNVTFTNPVAAGSTTSYTVSRTLTNNSAGSITINEIGIYQAHYYYAGGAYLGYFCTVRDVLGAGQAVVSTHNLAITYTVSVAN